MIVVDEKSCMTRGAFLSMIHMTRQLGMIHYGLAEKKCVVNGKTDV